LSTDTLERPVPIDPRIRERRIAVRRDQGRRRLQRLADVVAVLVVAAAFALAVRSPLLDVDAVEIAGADRTGAEAVATATRVVPGDQLVDVDVGAVGRRVGALPWVEEVTVRRSLGGAVRIEVTERIPVALALSGGQRWLVDASGAVIAPAADAPDLADGLATLTGVGEDLGPGAVLPAGAEDALEIAGRLGAAVPGAVEEVAVADDLVVGLALGGEARFGDARQLDAKVLALATILEEVDLDGLARIDLRLPGNPVLTREDP
jgi:cell division protein FtsQ